MARARHASRHHEMAQVAERQGVTGDSGLLLKTIPERLHHLVSSLVHVLGSEAVLVLAYQVRARELFCRLQPSLTVRGKILSRKPGKGLNAYRIAIMILVVFHDESTLCLDCKRKLVRAL